MLPQDKDGLLAMTDARLPGAKTSIADRARRLVIFASRGLALAPVHRQAYVAQFVELLAVSAK